MFEFITDEYGIGYVRQPCGRFFQFFLVARFGGYARHEMLHVHEEVESRADFVYVAVFHGKLTQFDAIRVVDIQRLPMLHHFLPYPVPVVTVVVLQENKLSVPENPVDARHVLPVESFAHDFQQVQVMVFLREGVLPSLTRNKASSVAKMPLA